MHELAIAQTLIESAGRNLPNPARAQVTQLTVQLGALAGLSSEELAFGFQVVAAGTPFADARLVIEEVPAIVYCPQCDTNFTPDAANALLCPACGAGQGRVLQGKELLLRSIEVNDAIEQE